MFVFLYGGKTSKPHQPLVLVLNKSEQSQRLKWLTSYLTRKKEQSFHMEVSFSTLHVNVNVII